MKKVFSSDYAKLFNLTVFNNDGSLHLRCSAEMKYLVMIIINQLSIQNGPNYITAIFYRPLLRSLYNLPLNPLDSSTIAGTSILISSLLTFLLASFRRLRKQKYAPPPIPPITSNTPNAIFIGLYHV